MRATSHASNLRWAMKKNARRQHPDIVKHSQILLSRSPVNTAHSKSDPGELLLATPDERKGSRDIKNLAFCGAILRLHSVESRVQALANNAIGRREHKKRVAFLLESFCKRCVVQHNFKIAKRHSSD